MPWWTRRKSPDKSRRLAPSHRPLYGAVNGRSNLLEVHEGRRAPPKRWVSDPQEVIRCLLYGIINTALCVPVSISFATIIFRHEAYMPFLPNLVRLVIFSSTVHMTCFAAFSSLNFAVGQVNSTWFVLVRWLTFELSCVSFWSGIVGYSSLWRRDTYYFTMHANRSKTPVWFSYRRWPLLSLLMI